MLLTSKKRAKRKEKEQRQERQFQMDVREIKK